MWNQAKQPRHGFAFSHSLITNISFRGSANKSSRVARPNIVLAQVNGWYNAEVFGVALALLNRLIVTTNYLIVVALLSPQTVPNAVDNSRNKSLKPR
jgi:hypothetical protein